MERVRREVRVARQALRRAARAAADLPTVELGRYRLEPGEQLNDLEILDFLRLAVDGVQQEVLIIVSQSDPDPDQESN